MVDRRIIMFRLALISALVISVVGVENHIAQFGGCLNQTRHAENPMQGETPGFHCHMDSTHCKDGEQWLNPQEVIDSGLGPCGCDDNMADNVHLHGCYDISGSHTVVCAYSEDQCPTNWTLLGGRWNSHHGIADNCTDGVTAFTNRAAAESCGKQCTCNVHFASGSSEVEFGSTPFGICYDETTRDFHCAVSGFACDTGYAFYGPHELGNRLEEPCTCDKTVVGACFHGSNAFSHCAVNVDSCLDGQSFMGPRALATSDRDIRCTLCEKTWDSDAAPSSSTANGDTDNGNNDVETGTIGVPTAPTDSGSASNRVKTVVALISFSALMALL